MNHNITSTLDNFRIIVYVLLYKFYPHTLRHSFKNENDDNLVHN